MSEAEEINVTPYDNLGYEEFGDRLQEIKKELAGLKEQEQELRAERENLEHMVLDRMRKQDVDRVANGKYSFSATKNEVANMTNSEKAMKWLIENDYWKSCIQKRITSRAVIEVLDDVKMEGQSIPGIERVTLKGLSLRKLG